MITYSALVLIVTLMVMIAICENYVYFKKIYQLISETVWKEDDIMDKTDMSDVGASSINWLERMAMVVLLCITSVLLWRNFDHYFIMIGKYTKEEFEKNLVSIEKRLEQRLDVLEDKIKDFENRYSHVDVETIYARQETTPKDQSVIHTNDACHQIDLGLEKLYPMRRNSYTIASGLVVDQSSQTSWPLTADVSQQTMAVLEADSPRSAYSVPVTTVATEDLPIREAASWYEEVQKEEMLMTNQNMMVMDFGSTPIGAWTGYELDVNQYPELEYKLNIHSVMESAELTDDQNIRPGSGEVGENSSNNANYCRQIPRYHGIKKGNPKQYHNAVRKSLNEDNSTFMQPKLSDSTKSSRQSTPKNYITSREGGESNQNLGPNRRRRPRNYNAK